MSYINQTSPLRSPTSTNDIQLKKRIEYLTQEMKAINVDHDEYITKERLFQYLDQKSGREFDRNIAGELFDQMDKTHDGYFTIDEFIRVYLEADEILRRKIDTAKQNKEHYRRQHEDSLKKSDKARTTERVNAYGIMEGSFVYVTIVSAHDLRAGLTGVVDPFVEVTLDRSHPSKTKVINDDHNPTWNEKFTFEAISGASRLRFSVMDYGSITRNSLIGEAEVALTELADQTIHEAFLDLFDQDGRVTQSKLNVKLQWIHSKVKYHALTAEKWKETYMKEQEELEEYQRYLINLWEPFQAMSQFKGNADQLPRGSVKSDSGLGAFDKRLILTVQNVTSKFLPDPADENIWLRIITYLCITTLFLSFLMSFQRTVFFEFVYSIAIILHIQRNLLNDFINWKYICIAVAISFLCIDIPFIVIYPGNWNENAKAETENLLNKTRTFVDVISYIHLVIKFIEIIVFYITYIYQKKAGNPRVSIRKLNLAAP